MTRKRPEPDWAFLDDPEDPEAPPVHPDQGELFPESEALDAGMTGPHGGRYDPATGVEIVDLDLPGDPE
jgi:hypothetical protein